MYLVGQSPPLNLKLQRAQGMRDTCARRRFHQECGEIMPNPVAAHQELLNKKSFDSHKSVII
jgi:hypothetical protein